MPKVWDGYKAPDWIDPEAFLFCGPDPAWTPAKEGIATAPPPPGECPHCRSRGCYAHDGDGNLVRDEWGEPVWLKGAIEDGSHAVCPRCRRYGLDRLLDRTPLSAMRLAPCDPADGVEGEVAPRADDAGKLDLSNLIASCAPAPEPGFVTVAVAAGSVSVPERFAHMLDGR